MASAQRKPIDNTGLYKLLGVDKKATPAQIKKAFFKFAKKNHPDKGGDAKVVTKSYTIPSYSSFKTIPRLTISSKMRIRELPMINTELRELKKAEAREATRATFSLNSSAEAAALKNVANKRQKRCLKSSKSPQKRATTGG